LKVVGPGRNLGKLHAVSAKRFEGKTVLITGAGSGIGEGMARGFAGEGAHVIVLDRDEELAAKIAGEIGGEAAVCDVSDHEAVREAFEQLLADRKLDVLVNNAGIAHVGSIETTSESDFDRVFSVNVKGVYNCLHAAVPYMVKAEEGVILNLASIAAKVGLDDRFAYSASKGAVYTMTLSVARDLLDKNIRCNCICPARVHTPFVDGYIKANYPGQEEEMFEKLSKTQPIGRMAKPEEIAKLATYLCSDDASFVTGQAWDIDGGYMMIR
jgi:2-keto-3-deoxy-L-fuconate dehydrogenase